MNSFKPVTSIPITLALYLSASSNVLHRKANVDYCVIGDGEIIIQNLVRTIKEKKTTDNDLNKILGITYINSKNEFKFTGYDHPLPASMVERPDYSIVYEAFSRVSAQAIYVLKTTRSPDDLLANSRYYYILI